MRMENTVRNNFMDLFYKIKQSRAVQTINQYLVSPVGLAIIGAVTLLAYVLAIELVFYPLLVVIAVYVCFFGEDLLPILPLVTFCYIVPNPKNNPATQANSYFFSSGVLIYLAILLSIVLISVVTRIIVDKNMGLKKLFTQKRRLLLGFLLLGGAFFLSGIGSTNYLQTFWKNLFFAFIQFISWFIVYFVFSATVDWKKVDKEYFFWFGIVMGIVVAGELLYIYWANNVIRDGSIIRDYIYTGWGPYNNVGAMLAMSIPCALYFAVEHKQGYLFIALAVLLLGGVVLTCSRAAILVAMIIFILGSVLLVIKIKNKWHLLTYVVILGIGVLIGICFFTDELIKLFLRVPDIFKPSEEGGIILGDSGRFEIYREGIKSYFKFPVFGDSFWPSGYKPWQFGQNHHTPGYMSIYPPRWHNTIIQFLASCGTVGIIAYVVHRVQTIKLVWKKRSTMTWFLVLVIGTLLLMGLLDCHMFNIWPVFFYSSALVFLEYVPQEEKKSLQDHSEKISVEQTVTEK